MIKKEIVIKGLGFEEFKEVYKSKEENNIEWLKILKKEVKSLSDFAIGPYFWFISTNNLEVLDSSNNLHELSPYKKNEWKNNYPNFLQPIIFEEDFLYFLGAVSFMMDFLDKFSIAERKNYKFSIYCRMQDKNKKLRWVAIQFPKIIYSLDSDSACGITTITDLSIFEIENKPRMTILNNTNKNNPYYAVTIGKNKIHNLTVPYITKREREILSLMIKGENTPQIAEKLFISYNTVENHKRNLRQKTSCKTSAELIYFVLKNNLI